jgi:6-methylsalicylic acid synthase
MACRFAGGISSPAQFWELLRAGRDVIGRVPQERWRWYASQSYEHAQVLREPTLRGAFLDDLTGFDADFFDITPREAALMDPQQRIILELAWEALEHAGIPPHDLAGSDTGVFMGVGSDDYGRRLLEDLPRIEAWTGIGGAYCAVANRVSHVLDLRGPSVAVDTACSSSLVSLHLAVQALRAGECPVALAGGVLVMAAPGLSVVLDAAGAIAPDGRSKSFDASADGYGRGEGAGIVVLKRLADARRDGDRVLALIRGSAVHQDGRTNGIMAPNGQAQAHLLRRAYRAAGIDPATVSYVEAHGTGTRVGDPLEAQAMSAVFGAGRPARQPCLIGSVKPNIGHLEAGAGVAGVIKTVLALHHAEIPPSVNFRTPNPAIDWASCGLRVVTEPTRWPATGKPHRAGVSAYGYGGTIAHVILEQAPASVAARPVWVTAAPQRLPAANAAVDPAVGPAVESAVGPAVESAAVGPAVDPAAAGPMLYPLSGASRPAVGQLAGRLAGWLARHPDVPAADIGYTLARRRSHLPYRAVVPAADREQLLAGLRELAATGGAPVAGPSQPAAARPGLVMVFSGHGSQWIGMARDLLAGEPVFREVIDALEPVFVEEMAVSPRDTIRADTPQPVDVVQPMIFAVQVGLAALWRACGVQPAAVIGHSVGEVAAAVVTGAYTLEQGARLVCRRSLLLRRAAGLGAMAMVSLPPAEVAQRLGRRPDVTVAVAAAATATVISGDIPAVEAVCRQWRSEGIEVRTVESDVAFHSPHMDPLVADLAAAAADLAPADPRIRLYSTALVDPRSGAPRDGAYWATNLRGQVRFAQAVSAAVEDGYRAFVEVSPHPVVVHSIGETLDALDIGDACLAHSLRRQQPARATLLANLSELHCYGIHIDWSWLWPTGALADLPTTAWQHTPHWAGEPPPLTSAGQHDPASHTLLGSRTVVSGTTPAYAWRTHLDRASRPYPGDHPVREVEIVPAAVLLSTFLAVAGTTGDRAELVDMALRVPVTVTRRRDLQVVLQDGTIRLSSRILDEAADDAAWVLHCTAAVETSTATGAGDPEVGSDAVTDVVADEDLPTGHVIDRLAALGVAAMGFPWVVEGLRGGEGALVATVRPAAEPGPAPSSWASILDAALSIASVAFPAAGTTLRMPAHLHRVRLAATAPARAHITVRVTAADTVDVQIVDEAGVVAGVLSRLRYGVLDSEVGMFTHPRRLVHQIAWRPLERRRTAVVPQVVLVGPGSDLRGWLAGHLRDAGSEPVEVATPEELPASAVTGDHAILVMPDPPQPGRVARAVPHGLWLLARTAQRLAGTGPAAGARLWCLTSGVAECRDESALGQSALWGLGRIIGGEHPEFWGGVVDIGGAAADVPALAGLLGSPPGEDVIVVRDGEPSVPRLRIPDGEPGKSLPSCRADATYLITGGLGTLGRQVARYLADRGARRLVLAGRRALPPRDRWDDLADPEQRAQVEQIRSLERLGVTVVTVAVDIADPAAVRRQLSPAGLGLPPICGVVHAAGVLDDRTVRALDEQSLRRVLRPKVDGALVLHECYPPGTLDFFALFSSCGQLLGLPGQASYAAGNAFLDALAAHRRAAGDTATCSLGWTSWRGLGMSTSSAVIDVELAARGTADISATEAFAAWGMVERYNLGYAAILRTLPQEPGERRLPLLSELKASRPAGSEHGSPDADQWRKLAGPQRHDFLAEEVRRQVASETKLLPVDVDLRRPLVEMGVDSVMNVRIRRALERRFRLPLPATLFWDHPTVDAVASLLAQLADADPVGEGTNR